MKFILLSVVIFSFLRLNAQNLVPNPGFEAFVKCPTGTTVLPRTEFIPSWTMPNIGTPDFYNECSVKCGVPMNWAGQRPAKEGKSYVGIVTRWNFETNDNTLVRREYVQAKLNSPLEAGKEYCVKFFTVLADNCQYATDGMGAYFSEKAPDSLDFNGNLPYVPQIQNIVNNIIYNDGKWKEICGIYKANGGEQFITIGNFKSDKETRWMKRGLELNIKYAYYYIDDVSVVPMLLPDDCTCSKEMVDFNNKNQTGTVDEKEYVRYDIDKLNIGQILILNGVQFYRNQPDLEPALTEELNLLVKFLTEYPSVEIAFSAFSDVEIPEDNHPKLIEARNNSILEFLVAKGIDASRLQFDKDADVRIVPYIRVVILKK